MFSAGGLDSPPVVAHTSGCRFEVAGDSSDQDRDAEDVDEQMVRPIRVVDNPFVRSSRALDYSTLRYGWSVGFVEKGPRCPMHCCTSSRV